MSTTDLLLAQLQWRYAVKQFDPSKKIPDDLWTTLEEAIVLTPSSFGLQPWRAVVVSDPAVRARLRGAAWNQPQVTDSSHLVVFAIQKSLGEKEIDHLLARIAEVRGGTTESLADFKGMMMGMLVQGPVAPFIDAWSARQAYIALGNLLTAAALLGVDACPMEGFDPGQFDEILGLGASRLGAVVMCTLGYRSAEDAYGHHAKVRFTHEEMFLRK